MCPPVMAAVTLAMGVAQAVAGHQAAQADYEAKSAQWRQNYTNALAAGRDEDRQLTLRQLQEQDAFVQKRHLSMVEQAQKKSEAAVASTASGVSGISVDNILADVDRQAGLNQSTLETNWKNTAQQLQTEKNASVNRTQSRISSVTRPTSPSGASLFVGILGAGVKAASTPGLFQ